MITHNIVIPVNHGIGDELALTGPFISALLRQKAQVSIWTFHAGLYAHSSVTVHDWHEEKHLPFAPPVCDHGYCLATREPRNLPLQFDRSPLVESACREAGWTMLDGDGRDIGLSLSGPYDYTTHVLAEIGYSYPTPPWDFLPRIPKSRVLLNLLGKGDICKGLPHSLAWDVVSQVAEYLPDISFFVVHLVDQNHPEPPLWINELKNLKIERVAFGSASATQLYCEASLIVSAEGGGYHLAYGAGTPALLVTSKQWFSVVRQYALPPINHHVLLFDATETATLFVKDKANEIAEWITNRKCPTTPSLVA